MTDERNVERDEWLRHENTQRLKGKVHEQRKRLLFAIVQAAESCQDVAVRTAVANYRACDRTLAMLTHGDEWGGKCGPLPDLPDAKPGM